MLNLIKFNFLNMPLINSTKDGWSSKIIYIIYMWQYIIYTYICQSPWVNWIQVNMCDLPNHTPADFDLEAILVLLINLRRINKLYKWNFWVIYIKTNMRECIFPSDTLRIFIPLCIDINLSKYVINYFKAIGILETIGKNK